MVKIIDIDDIDLIALKSLRLKLKSLRTSCFGFFDKEVEIEFCIKSLRLINVNPYAGITYPYVLFDGHNMQIDNWNIFANIINNSVFTTASTFQNIDTSAAKLLVHNKDDREQKMYFNLHESVEHYRLYLADVKYIDSSSQINKIKNYDQFKTIVPMDQYYDVTFGVQFYLINNKFIPWIYLKKFSPSVNDRREYTMYSKKKISQHYKEYIKDLTLNIHTTDDCIYV